MSADSQKPVRFIMPALSEADVGAVVVEEITLEGRLLRIAKPAAPDQLLELEAVDAAYKVDEYMPYWATIWPVARYLSADILRDFAVSPAPGAPRPRAIELGAGLGLPGLAALFAGYHVTFTDNDATAVHFAERNARLNGFGEDRFVACTMDWRDPVQEQFDMVICSDILYEGRLVDPVVTALAKLLKPDGVGIIADQNRAYAQMLRDAMPRYGLSYTSRGFAIAPELAWEVTGTLYWARHAQQKSPS